MTLTIPLPPLTPTPSRPLFLNGVLDATTINVWYHTALYSCVLFSGAVDVLVDAGHMPQKADAIVRCKKEGVAQNRPWALGRSGQKCRLCTRRCAATASSSR